MPNVDSLTSFLGPVASGITGLCYVPVPMAVSNSGLIPILPFGPTTWGRCPISGEDRGGRGHLALQTQRFQMQTPNMAPGAGKKSQYLHK